MEVAAGRRRRQRRLGHVRAGPRHRLRHAADGDAAVPAAGRQRSAGWWRARSAASRRRPSARTCAASSSCSRPARSPRRRARPAPRREPGDEGGVLLRQGGHPRRAGARPADPQPARRHRQGHDAPRSAAPTCTSTTATSRPWSAATSSATSSWARSSRSAAATIASRSATASSCRSPSRAATASSATSSCGRCATTRTRTPALAEKLAGYSGSGLFGYSHIYGGYAGRPGRVRARAVRRRRPDQGARVAGGRAGAVPVRHLPDRLHGGRELRHPARRHGRGLGLRPGRPVRHQERLAARRRARHRHRPLPGAAGHGRRRRARPRSSTTRRSTCWRRCAR